jgi:DNA repair photolyase
MFVRWESLQIAESPQHRLPGYRDPAAIRRFDAPEALDMRFYEVQAKSVLNRVPERSPMPFRWTINPYRGCSHACAYCVSGDTAVLMADGREKPIAELEVGEQIYGTRLGGAFRRLVRTEVLDRWTSVKEAHAVKLEDGTVIVASADHRFLTDRGWKHVTDSEPGARQRPHLSNGDELLGCRAEQTAEGAAVAAAAKLGVAAIEPLGISMPMYDITTGTGDFIADGVVSHNCFARPTHTYLGFDAGRDFEREIVVKVNAPEVLKAELGRRSWRREHVALGTNTDPYQWVEGRYRLMEGIWEALRDGANPCSVLTKSPLLLRDLKLMVEIAQRTTFTACLSIPTLDEKVWRETEPHTPSPRARLEAVAELNRAGIATGVLIAPLMPGINDAPHQVEPLLEQAAEAGAANIAGTGLHLRGEVREVFFDWLRARRPDLEQTYNELYRRGANLPQGERERLARMARRGGSPGSFWRDRYAERSPDRHEPEPAGVQQSLF